MSRSRRLILIVLGVLAFLAISVELARFLSVENAERDSELVLLQAQAAGNAQAMLAQLDPSCRLAPTCVAAVHENATGLRRPGSVKILLLQSRTAYSLSSATAPSRVAWTIIGRLPVVQCVLVRRTGNVLTGLSVSLLRLSLPISSTGVC